MHDIGISPYPTYELLNDINRLTSLKVMKKFPLIVLDFWANVPQIQIELNVNQMLVFQTNIIVGRYNLDFT